MKTASVQHLNAIVNNRDYASSYHLEFKKLTHAGTYIMNKLTNVSPFLLLLIPAFIMMVFTMTATMDKTSQNGAMLKQSTTLETAKISGQYTK